MYCQQLRSSLVILTIYLPLTVPSICHFLCLCGQELRSVRLFNPTGHPAVCLSVCPSVGMSECTANNYGHLGCSVDVLSYLDAACSGLNSCEFSVSDPALVRTRPCPPDFASYLDVEYRCVPGTSILHHFYVTRHVMLL